MNEYIFYTTEGITLPPNEDEDIDNCQILGSVEARNSSEAMDLLLKNNPWIDETGFSKSEIMIKQVLKKEQSKGIQAIVDKIGMTKKSIIKNMDMIYFSNIHKN